MDKINRFSVDPVKIFLFAICSTRIFFLLLLPDSIIEVELLSGDMGYRPADSLNTWLIILNFITISYLTYYIILIYIRTPAPMKKKARLFAIGGFVFGVVTLLILLLGIPFQIPGLEIIPLAIGVLISSKALVTSPELTKHAQLTHERSKIRYITHIMPICAKCKKIRDISDNWWPIEDYLLKHSGMKFTHGYCPVCEKEILTKIENDHLSEENE